MTTKPIPTAQEIEDAAEATARGLPGTGWAMLTRLAEAVEAGRLIEPEPGHVLVADDPGPVEALEAAVAERDAVIVAIRARLEDAETRVRALADTARRLAVGEAADELLRLIDAQEATTFGRYVWLADSVKEAEAETERVRSALRSMRDLLEVTLDMPPRGPDRHRAIRETIGEIECEGGI